MRLFIGIPLGDAVVGEVTALVSRLRESEPEPKAGVSGWRWTEPESWHITLEFLGNSTAEQLQCLTARLGEVRSAQVPVQLGELGCFERAGVFFADVMVTPELTALEQRVIAATSRCGFSAEERPFHPHITLARRSGKKGTGDRGNKRNDPLRELMARVGRQPAFTRFTACEFLLYESHTDREGARYAVKSRFALGP
jgi:RNA 2',3'-cyclic 3'-phosphodiesterase